MIQEQPIIEKYYPGTPNFHELYKKVSFVFLNMNQLLDVGRPTSGKIKFIGGIHLEKNENKLKHLDEVSVF